MLLMKIYSYRIDLMGRADVKIVSQQEFDDRSRKVGSGSRTIILGSKTRVHIKVYESTKIN